MVSMLFFTSELKSCITPSYTFTLSENEGAIAVKNIKGLGSRPVVVNADLRWTSLESSGKAQNP